MKFAPIVVFAYNRPDHLEQTLNALAKNELANQSELFIYCDGAKPGASSQETDNIQAVRALAKKQTWCKSLKIIESENNKGLADSIVGGVTDLTNQYGRVIVLEDDIITSKGFLKYMNDALELFKEDKKVMHISGYVPETAGIKPKKLFLSRFMSCWGWATWKNRWQHASWDPKYLLDIISLDSKTLKHFNLDGYIDFDEQLKFNINGQRKTWAVKWFASIYIQQGLSLYPAQSMVRNIGTDGSGDNYYKTQDVKTSNEYINKLLDYQPVKRINIAESKVGRYYLKKYYRFGKRMNLMKEIFFLLKEGYK